MLSIELEKQQSVIVSLKKQINAHFTINTINIIRRLSEIGEHETVGVLCESLSHLMRYINSADSLVSGMEEMMVLEKYLFIMQLRYPEQISSSIDIDDSMDQVYLPRMLVQPLVENALIHGLAGRCGTVSIIATVEDDNIVISVTDNGCGMGDRQLQGLRKKIASAHQLSLNEMGTEHIAMLNIQKRIGLLFGNQYGLSISSFKGHGTTATICLPNCSQT